ncbi:MAG TPA: FAD-dependent oxidoreductase [Stellaceae bacterium]|jgi:UDP-galactopyranose mutase|nr:FAD-dependent oxidoreductase [Stellaceae bacterium]
MEADYLVVGSGLTGATIARELADHGRDVVVIERRPEVGGNLHDTVHSSGIRIHTYGPHYFRTSSDHIWNYVRRFADFYPFEAVLMSEIDDRLEHWPVHAEYIARCIGADWRPSHIGPAANFEEASLAMMPALVYEKFVKGYTAKQWGVAPRTLAAGLAGRFDVRRNGDTRLKTSRFQGIPYGGYGAMMRQMLAGIRVVCGTDYLQHRGNFSARRGVFFTGPIDEYFGFDLGRLAYRGQHRDHRYLPDTQWHQPTSQTNHPDPAVSAIRTLEWKHMMEPALRDTLPGTVITTETPYTPDEPGDYEYPFPDAANQALYARYRERADATPGLVMCGRLGDYRYYDMDQAIGRALTLVRRYCGDQ